MKNGTRITDSTSDVGSMSEFDHEISCSCCTEPIELGIDCYLDIRTNIPHDDERLAVLLYHNWITPDTAYIIFGTTHRILGLSPLNPFLKWLGLEPDAD